MEGGDEDFFTESANGCQQTQDVSSGHLMSQHFLRKLGEDVVCVEQRVFAMQPTFDDFPVWTARVIAPLCCEHDIGVMNGSEHGARVIPSSLW